MPRSLTFFLAAGWLLTPTIARAFPVAVIAAFFDIGIALATVVTFLINTAISIALNAVVNKIFGPHSNASAAQQRQASVLSLTIGEAPRMAIFGRAATGGVLLDAFNFGGANDTDWEVLIVKLADHQCDALEGFFIGDTFYAFTGDGAVSGFSGQLEVYFKDGAPGQAASAYLLANSPSRLYGTAWTSADVVASQAYVVAAYKADAPNATAPVWPQGRPSFRWVVRGALCYDPRQAAPEVVLLCGFEGADGTTSFVDESLYARALTAVGTSEISTTAHKFGASSFNNPAGSSHVDAAISADFAFAGEFTIETFIQWTDIAYLAGDNGIVSSWTDAAGGWALTSIATGPGLRFYVGPSLAGGTSIGGDFTFADGVSYHVAVDRDAANKVRVYVDGAMIGSATYATAIGAPEKLQIGNWTAGLFSRSMQGYLDELCITNGHAKYANDAGYPVPSAPFPRQAVFEDPGTWAWSENAAICDYAYDRGIYAENQVTDPTQLLIGRGLAAEEAPPDRVAARANLCDEAVALLAGGTEPRYRVGGVVFSNEAFRDIKQKFADAMGGDIVKRLGGVEVLPGAAQSVVREITDHDLVLLEGVAYEPFLSSTQRVNTVIPHYVAPDQLWNTVTAPIRRSTEDIVDDGGQKIADVALDLVTSQTQAQRICEIKRRLARKEQRAALVLAPPHADLEDGDWIGWTSDRYFNGGRAVFRLDGYAVQQNWRNSIVLREISADCYAWDETVDEGVPGHAPVDEFGSLDPVALTGVTAVAIAKTGAGGETFPAVRFFWDEPVDNAIIRIRAEVREVGQLEVAPTITDDVNAGVMDVTNGVGPTMNLEGRLVPLGVPGRAFTPSPWIAIATSSLSASDLSAFLWTVDLNLDTFGVFIPVNGTVAVGVPPDPPFANPPTAGAFGDQMMALEIPGGSPSNKVERTATHGLVSDGYSYAFQVKAKTSDAGGSTIRMGFRDAMGAAFPSLPDQVFALTTTPTTCTWDHISCDDPGFNDPAVKKIIFDQAGDIDAGETVTVTDLVMYLGPVFGRGLQARWRPSPDELNLQRYNTLLVGSFAARRLDAPLQAMRSNALGTADEYAPIGPASVRTVA